MLVTKGIPAEGVAHAIDRDVELFTISSPSHRARQYSLSSGRRLAHDHCSYRYGYRIKRAGISDRLSWRHGRDDVTHTCHPATDKLLRLMSLPHPQTS